MAASSQPFESKALESKEIKTASEKLKSIHPGTLQKFNIDAKEIATWSAVAKALDGMKQKLKKIEYNFNIPISERTSELNFQNLRLLADESKADTQIRQLTSKFNAQYAHTYASFETELQQTIQFADVLQHTHQADTSLESLRESCAAALMYSCKKYYEELLADSDFDDEDENSTAELKAHISTTQQKTLKTLNDLTLGLNITMQFTPQGLIDVQIPEHVKLVQFQILFSKMLEQKIVGRTVLTMKLQNHTDLFHITTDSDNNLVFQFSNKTHHYEIQLGKAASELRTPLATLSSFADYQDTFNQQLTELQTIMHEFNNQVATKEKVLLAKQEKEDAPKKAHEAELARTHQLYKAATSVTESKETKKTPPASVVSHDDIVNLIKQVLNDNARLWKQSKLNPLASPLWKEPDTITDLKETLTKKPLTAQEKLVEIENILLRTDAGKIIKIKDQKAAKGQSRDLSLEDMAKYNKKPRMQLYITLHRALTLISSSKNAPTPDKIYADLIEGFNRIQSSIGSFKLKVKVSDTRKPQGGR